MKIETTNSPRRSATSQAGHLTIYALIATLITFAIAEVTTRLITEQTGNGTLKFRTVDLVPYRPDEAHIRQALYAWRHDHLLMPDFDLGWTVRPNKTDGGDHTNAQGIRTNPEHLYSINPPKGKVRIVTIGDSYVYCMQVNEGETWQDYLGQMRDDVEFLNLGLPGAGTDQAFLRWKRDGKKFKSQIVLLGIWPDNINRNLSIVGYYLSHGLPATKPRLAQDDAGTWKFVNSPIMSDDELVATLTNPEGNPLLRYDYWYHHDETIPSPYRKSRLLQFAESIWYRYQRKLTYKKIFTGEIPDGNDVTVAITKIFAKEVRDAGSIPLVVMIPDRTRLSMHVGPKPFPLVQRLRDAGIDVIDMGPTFGKEVMKEGAAKYYVDGVGHNTPFGNQVFARYLEKDLSLWIEKAKEHSNEVQRIKNGTHASEK